MKKSLLVFLLFAAVRAEAQFYAGATGGVYHSAAAESYLYEYTDDGPAGTLTMEYRKRSYGSGATAGVYAGAKLTGNLYGELSVVQLFGSGYHSNTLFISPSGNVHQVDVLSYVNAMRVAPSLLYAFTRGEEGRRLQSYARVGLVYQAMSKLHMNTTETFSNGPVQMIETDKVYTGGFSIGTSGAIGLRRLFGTHWLLGGEVSAIMQHWAPTHSEITRYEVDGTNQLSTLSVSQRETNYDYHVVFGTTTYSPSQPSQDLRLRYPMSSIGITLGAAYTF